MDQAHKSDRRQTV